MTPTVLIVDDLEDNRLVLGDLLEGEGYALREACDGVEALECVEREVPDLILLDIMMPRMDGLECCRRVTASPRTSHIPVILVTALDDDVNLVAGLEAGATDYITKPFSGAVVRARIRAALRAKLNHDDLQRNRGKIERLVEELEEKNRELRELALRDGLTGLPNRLLLMDRLDESLARSRREPAYRFALLFLDFDRFKLVNDTLGHEVGDELLRSIGARLQSELRQIDAVTGPPLGAVPSRLGGDEFVILLENLAGREDLDAVVGRLQAALAEPHLLGGRKVVSTASIGVVMSDHEYAQAGEMLRDADAAMYQAKEAGTARHVVFDLAMRHAALERSGMEAGLQRAVEDRTLAVHYQPIYRLEDGRMAGVEAVVRWPHPDRGLLVSEAFLDVADQSGLIVPLGRFVVEAACRQMRCWRERCGSAAPRQLTVNLWERQLHDPDLSDFICRSLEETGLDPPVLTLEIPERVFLDGTEASREMIERLRRLGVRLSMDGCGRGHSALTSLHTLPIDLLKIDRSVTCNLDGRIAYAAVVQAVITLAHNLDLEVVAVGIETGAQLAQLQALECDWGQGRYLTAPASGEEILALVTGPHASAGPIPDTRRQERRKEDTR